MIQHRLPAVEPLQLLIWGASGLISVLLGAGLAFFLWLRLHGVAPDLLVPLVAFFGIAIFLAGYTADRRWEGRLLMVMALSVVASYVAGIPYFPGLG